MSWSQYSPPDLKTRIKERLPLIGVGALAVTLIVGAIALAGGVASDEPGTPKQTATARVTPDTVVPVTVDSTGSTTTSIPGPETALHTDVTDTQRSIAISAAVRFVQAWGQTDLPPGQWLAGIAPLVTPDALAKFRTTDPGYNPAVTVTGNGRIQAIGAFSALVDIPTDAGTVRVTLDTLEGNPLVSTIEPVEAGPAQVGPTPVG